MIRLYFVRDFKTLLMKNIQHLTIIFISGMIWLTPLNAQMHDLDKSLPCLNKTFNIHVHIVLDEHGESRVDLEGLKNALIDVSEYFDPICTDFVICEVDSILNHNYGVMTTEGPELNEMVAEYQVSNRINLYLIDALLNACGLARLSSIGDPDHAFLIVESFLCTSGPVLAHELGHLFGLVHTFNGLRDELVNGSNGETAGDQIQDTPADPYIVSDSLHHYIDGCEFIYEGRDANGQYYQPDVGNIMSYYGCACGFSKGQFNVMVTNYLNSNPKLW